ncbi:MAG: enoyl-CoA hydratase/isomerase family protein [Patulibacter sp.]|nr:enoyl-CoA hydratase/isomerase family protein [Patulibacter sp.]
MSVTVEVSGSRADVSIERPDVLNALDAAHHERLLEAWDEVERDERVRVAVLRAAGDRAFCVGADMKADDPEGLDYWLRPHRAGFGGISRRGTMRFPTVARVNGHALGGGFEMVLACDLAVASTKASFGLPEVLVGRVPLDGGVRLLAASLPPKVARELLLTGRRIDAEEALARGLVNRVVEPDRLDEAVDELVDRLLRGAPLSQHAIKDALAGGDTAAATPSLIRALTSRDGEEGPRAFRERRTPTWEAR